MTDQSNITTNGIINSPLHGYAARISAVNTELAQKLMEMNSYWINQMRIEWGEAADLSRKLGSNGTASEKVTAIQDWLKALTERGFQEIKYTFDVAQALGNIELKVFTRPSDETGSSAKSTGSTTAYQP